MTVPKLAFNYIKTFGSPWHGIVKNGLLSLPNGGVMEYPQPGNGDTVLVKFSGLPGINRSGAQVVLDAEQGKSWRNYAIISGTGQLYGKNIPSRWLHRDEEGRVWAVNVSQPVPNSSLLQLTLSDFGRIGLSLTPRDNVVLNLNVGATLFGAPSMLDVRPDGNQAVFRGNVGSDIYFTISLSGLMASASIVKTQAETTVTVSGSINTDDDNLGEPVAIYRLDGPGSVAEWSTSPLDGAGPPTSIGENRVRIRNNGIYQKRTIITRAFYGRNSQLKFVAVEMYREAKSVTTENTSVEAEISATLNFCTGSGGGFSSVNSITKNEVVNTYSYSVLLDDVLVQKYNVTASRFSSETLTRDTVYGPPACEFTGGGTWVPTLPEEEVEDLTFDSAPVEWQLDGVPLSASIQIFPNSYIYDFSFLSFATSSAGLPWFLFVVATNKIVYSVIEYRYQPGFLLGSHVAPDAIDDGTQFVENLGDTYTTYQPETMQIIRGEPVPICFV